MDYKWEQFGDEIKQSVQDAVERGDFSRLNQTVNDSVGRCNLAGNEKWGLVS